jgi:hypothetical protein
MALLRRSQAGGAAVTGELATNASLGSPRGVAMDALGSLYIAESGGNRIRRVASDGTITTVAGNGALGNAGNGGPATNASLLQPWYVAFDASDNLYFSEGGFIKKVLASVGRPTLEFDRVTTNIAGSYIVVVSDASGSVTSSVATLTVNIRPSIVGTVLHADGSVTLNSAGTPNSTNRVWVATSVASPVVWWAASTNVAGPDGTWQFTDTGTAGYPARFYRVSMP